MWATPEPCLPFIGLHFIVKIRQKHDYKEQDVKFRGVVKFKSTTTTSPADCKESAACFRPSHSLKSFSLDVFFSPATQLKSSLSLVQQLGCKLLRAVYFSPPVCAQRTICWPCVSASIPVCACSCFSPLFNAVDN